MRKFLEDAGAGTTIAVGVVGLRHRAIALTIVEQEVGSARPSGTSGVPKLGEYFIRRGMLSPGQVQRVIERQNELGRSGSRLPFGQVAYDMGFISRSQLDTALADLRNDFNERFWD